jgi:Clathrin adaptor complex small chain
VQHGSLLQANFIQYRGFTVVYRRYASLFFMVGIDNNQVRKLRDVLKRS